MVRFVLDTNVVVAGLRSPSGASAALLRAGRHQQVTLLGNVAMVLEYEAVCHLPEHREAAGVDAQDIEYSGGVPRARGEPFSVASCSARSQ
jgi:predicted nucleic acid-binding protein